VGIVLLSVVLQLVDVPDRTPDREQRLRVTEAQAPARVSARERAESRYEQGKEVQDQRAIERLLLTERNRDVPPPFHHLSDEQLRQRQVGVVREKDAGPWHFTLHLMVGYTSGVMAREPCLEV